MGKVFLSYWYVLALKNNKEKESEVITEFFCSKVIMEFPKLNIMDYLI